ncbi:hypothetical protein G6F56_013606 [Rhizopus delemar]|nr:hypothetical protein G6F56_013606 [Rhizopus delemar]
MDCTTIQSAESGHSALKKGMISLQPLDMAFDSINEYVEVFEREYNEIELYERSTVGPFTKKELRLERLTFKVSHQELKMIRVELSKIEKDKKDSQNCPYKCKVAFGIPCHHLLSLLDREKVYLTDIQSRWWIIKEKKYDEAATDFEETTSPNIILHKP